MESSLLSDYVTAGDSLYDMLTSQYAMSPGDMGYGSMTSDDNSSLHSDSLSPNSNPEQFHGFPTDGMTYPMCSYTHTATHPNVYGDFREPEYIGSYQDNSFMYASNPYITASSTTSSTTTDACYSPHAQFQTHFIPAEQMYQQFSQIQPEHLPPKPKRKRVQTMCQRKAANVRERKRMCSVNSAFDVLKKRVPTFSYEKRLSRIETLKLAIDYIAFMTDILNGKNPDEVPLSRFASAEKKNRDSLTNELDIV